MGAELLSALCLVLVIEGLFLFAAPEGWKRMAAQMQAVPALALRRFGGLMVAVGLLLLYVVRGG